MRKFIKNLILGLADYYSMINDCYKSKFRLSAVKERSLIIKKSFSIIGSVINIHPDDYPLSIIVGFIFYQLLGRWQKDFKKIRSKTQRYLVNFYFVFIFLIFIFVLFF